MNKNTAQLQQEIFARVTKSFGGDKDKLILWLQENFNLGLTSVYRRLNGTTLLNLEELLRLSKSFKIPINELFDTPNDLIYFYLENNRPSSYEDWMRTTHANLSTVCSQPNVVMHYTSTENPIFYHFHFEELTRFKLYIWARAMWELPELSNEPFDIKSSLWTKETEVYRKKMLTTYTELDSVEFWTPNIMHNNLSQIQYYMEGYQFVERKDALLLCEQLRQMMKLLLVQTQNSEKIAVEGCERTGSFELYYNEILHTNNTLFFKYDGGKALYATFGNPTTIKTGQDAACDYAEEWFEKLKRRSMKISSSSERERLRLFKMTEEKINKAEKYFQGLI